jgi:hypothetical protein
MNVILGTAFSITLGIWRLRVRVAIEDTAFGDVPEPHAERMSRQADLA